MDPNGEIIKKFTKKFGNKVTNTQGLRKKINYSPTSRWSRKSTQLDG